MCAISRQFGQYTGIKVTALSLFAKTRFMTCLIRQADTEDLPLLPHIERESGELFRSISELAFVADDAVTSIRDLMSFSKDGVVFVAQSLEGPSAGALVGFICGAHVGKVLHIQQMSVLPSDQGRGVGSALMAAILDDAISMKLARATLTTFLDVPWNDGFYRKLGFSTLANEELDQRLIDILAKEAAAGLPASRRCAMAIQLS
jgi:ribosomal protein S18 acetylase RimI-like enzyme